MKLDRGSASGDEACWESFYRDETGAVGCAAAE